MKYAHTPIIICTLLCMVLLLNCKKKETPTPTNTNATPISTTTCFNNLYNGTYVGSGFLMSTPFTAGTLTVSKISCQVVYLSLSTNIGGGVSDQVSQVTINTANTYDGVQSNGNKITLSPGGNNFQVNAIGSFTFNGNK